MSNVISQGQGGANTTPSPIPTARTILSLDVNKVTNGLSLSSVLAFSPNGQIVTASEGGLSITYTGTGVPPNLVATVEASLPANFFITIKPPTTPGTYTFQAHFAGTEINGVCLKVRFADNDVYSSLI